MPITSATPGTRQVVTSEDMAHGRPPVTIAHCAICSEEYEYVPGASHRCRLSPADEAKIAKARVDWREAEAKRKASTPCPDCHTLMKPGTFHFCRIKTDKSLPDPLTEAAKVVRDAGYSITTKAK